MCWLKIINRKNQKSTAFSFEENLQCASVQCCAVRFKSSISTSLLFPRILGLSSKERGFAMDEVLELSQSCWVPRPLRTGRGRFNECFLSVILWFSQPVLSSSPCAKKGRIILCASGGDDLSGLVKSLLS